MTELIQDNETNSESEFGAFMSSLPPEMIGSSKKTYERHFRYYDIVADNGEDIIMIFNELSIKAGKRRIALRKLGYKVSMYEVSTLPGVVEPITDELNGKGVPNPIPYETAVLRAQTKRKSASLAKRSPYQITRWRDNKIRVYHHGNLAITNADLEIVVKQIQSLEESGRWEKNDWTIYLPEAFYNLVTR